MTDIVKKTFAKSDKSPVAFRMLAAYYWTKACQYDGINTLSKFAVFTDDNPYIGLRNWLYWTSFQA